MMRTYLKYGVVAALSLLPLFVVCTTLYSWFYYQWPGIYVDAWEYLDLIEKYYNDNANWSDWFYPHALIHRLVIPRALFLAEVEFFGARNIFSNGISLVTHLAALGLLLMVLHKGTTLSRIEKTVLSCFWAIAIFYAGQLYNLTDPTQNQLFLAMFFVLSAIYLYHGYSPVTGNNWHIPVLLVVVLLFVCATLSNFFGFIAWAVFVVFLLMRKESSTARITVIGLFVVAALLYFPVPQVDVKGFAGVPGAKVSLTSLIAPGTPYTVIAGQVVSYLGIFFSYPVAVEYGGLTIFIGCAVFVFSIWLLLRAFFGDRTPVFFCYLLAFILAVNSSIVFSRFMFSDPRALRFDFYQLWFIIGLVSVLVFELRVKPWCQYAVWAFVALVTALLLSRQLPVLDEHYQRYIKVSKANLAYYVGSDTAYKTHIVNNFEVNAKVNVLAEFREFLRAHTAGPYREYAFFDWQQSPPDKPADLPCQLKRVQMKSWDNQVVELRGVLVEKSAQTQTASWLVFNSRARAAGLGIIFPDRANDKPQQHRWAIFFRADADGKPITLWLKSAAGAYLCSAELNVQDMENMDDKWTP